MTAVHFRYGWISQSRLRQCFPVSPELEQLAILLRGRPALLAEIIRLDGVPHAIDDLVRWIEQPKWRERPTRRRLRQARHRAAANALFTTHALLSWIDDVLAIVNRTDREVELTSQRMTVIQNLAQTDFPTLLLWRNPRLARRLFCHSAVGSVRSQLAQDRRQLLRAVRVCLAFALAGSSRLAPRDGWVGVGFADGFKTDPSLQISRATEQFIIEPDIAWIKRRWIDLPKCQLDPGMSPWSYAFKTASGGSRRARERMRTLLVLKQKCGAIAKNALNFAAVSTFLDETEAMWRQTVPSNVWAADPHCWWVTRCLPVEASAPDRLRHLLESAYAAARSALLAQEIVRDAPCPDVGSRRQPYAVRVGVNVPEAVQLVADEVFDTVVDAAKVRGRSALQLYLPRHPKADMVPVGSFDERGLRFLFFDPSPRRSAERFALLLAHTPAYCTSQPRVVALRPPTDLVDNRLVRLSAEEIAPSEVVTGAMVEFRSALVTPGVAPLVALETASYVDRDLPDLIPVFTDTTKQIRLSFGALDRINQVWLLTHEEALSLAGAVRTSDTLALLYYLEIHEVFGSPIWIDVIADGKRTSMPTHSFVAFDFLLHLMRTAAGAVAVHVPQTIATESVVVDEHRQGIAAVAFLRK